MKKRLQNKIAESRYSLPVVVSFTVVVWILALTNPHSIIYHSTSIFDKAFFTEISDINTRVPHFLPFGNRGILSLAVILLTSWLMVRLNTIYALMRVYSRMISCSFLALSLIIMPVVVPLEGALLTLGMAIIYLLMFSCYQDKDTIGRIFLTFIVVGLISLLYIRVLYFLPFLWFILSTRMMAMSWRGFFASLLGLITPYWFAAVYCFATNKIPWLINHLTDVAVFTPIFDNAPTSVVDICMPAIIIVIVIMGIIHFINTSHNDKIKTRMIYESLIIINIAIIIFMVLQPVRISFLLPMLIVSGSPLVAHYVTYTNTRLTNLSFIVMLILVIGTSMYYIL